MTRSFQVLVLLTLGLSFAAEQPAPVVPPVAPPAAAAEADPAKAESTLMAPEEKWIFDPMTGRPDIFIDLEAEMNLKLMIIDAEKGEDGDGPIAPIDPHDKNWSKQQMERVESCIVAKKWDEAMKICDVSIKTLKKKPDDEDVRQDIDKFTRYFTQAEEAKTYEEAQQKFDALDLQIEGILWSPEGSLAVINGEPRALGRDERVKDCVILTIDTNRVDFLFIYKRRRFEFQRYVGEESKANVGKNKAIK
jgi:hypothetical protein